MCGIIAILLANKESAVNQELYDGLTILQHRGQDAAGIVTSDQRNRLHLHKDQGFVRDVFKLNHMINLLGHYGLGHCRYPTAGVQSNVHEAQPFVTNIPFGLCLVHNGNITNTEEIEKELSWKYHLNTDSDTELILSLLADELLSQAAEEPNNIKFGPSHYFQAVQNLMKRARGGYAVAVIVNGQGILVFRDPNGIRPLAFGSRATSKGTDWCAASESVAVESLGYTLERDIRPGEAVFFGLDGQVVSQMCHDLPVLSPCIFEYVYFGRPDSVLDGVSVYRSRQLMGNYLANKIQREKNIEDIDVVCPVPDTSRISALQCALRLGLPYEEGLTKNRYIARTFIMPGQKKREKNVRKKLNPINEVFQGKNVLLIDDSIVRGTTSRQIINMCRQAGAKKVFFCSASPPIKYPNVYGIDMPVQSELVAFNRTEEQVANYIGADWVVYQDMDDLEQAVKSLNPKIDRFDCSCFCGEYVTGDITEAYFSELVSLRSNEALQAANEQNNRTHTSSDFEGNEQDRSNANVMQNGIPEPPQQSQEIISQPNAPVPEDASEASKSLEDLGPNGELAPQQVMRGRRIAGLKRATSDEHVSSKDFKNLGDRLSGWM